MPTIQIFIFVIIIISAVFHEYAHGFIAHRLGDDTAKRAGRLTLNPLAHIDPFGTLILPLFLLLTAGIFIGWAKPVPYNPYNLRDPKYGNLKVAIAGPITNLIIALVLGLIIRFAGLGLVAGGIISPIFIELLAFIVYINIFLAIFNLIPFPPLDGSKIFFDLFPKAARSIIALGSIGIVIALFIAFFFLSPVANFIFALITGINGLF